ncbi:hypothetical protein ABIC78_000962 [Novosphingobium sp. 1529]|uniref:alginate export family protein n=1 Tax=unclassified Novosphingobium TaxID=2644732 RepID=UPI000AB7C45B|nr:alginate export family protein [Novosphingobium sp. AAP1]
MPALCHRARLPGAALLAATALAAAPPALAGEAPPADGLAISGQIRLRYEVIDGQARPNANRTDQLINTRATIKAAWTKGPWQVVGELWDARVFNDNPGTPITTGEVNAIELVQGYVGLDLPGHLGKGSKLNVRLGRETLNIGSRRLIAADDYRNTINSYTGLHAEAQWPSGWRASLVFTLPDQRLPLDRRGMHVHRFAWDHEGFDLMLWGGFVGKVISAKGAPVTLVEAGLLHLGERDRPDTPTRDRSLNTSSLRLAAEPAPAHLDYELEGNYQWGEEATVMAPNAPLLPVSAGNLHVRVGYTFADKAKTHLTAELDYATGDTPGGTITRYDPLYATRRNDFAPAGLYNVPYRANIIAPGLRLEGAPSKRFDYLLTWHPMWLANAHDMFGSSGVRDAAGTSGTFAGHQFDSRLRYWAVPRRLRLEFDGVYLAKGGFMQTAPNAQPGQSTTYGSFNVTAFY